MYCCYGIIYRSKEIESTISTSWLCISLDFVIRDHHHYRHMKRALYVEEYRNLQSTPGKLHLPTRACFLWALAKKLIRLDFEAQTSEMDWHLSPSAPAHSWLVGSSSESLSLILMNSSRCQPQWGQGIIKGKARTKFSHAVLTCSFGFSGYQTLM